MLDPMEELDMAYKLRLITLDHYLYWVAFLSK